MKKTVHDQKGFLLPMVAIALAAFSIAALGAIPKQIQTYRTKAAVKMAKEIQVLLSAARLYKQDTSSWPSSVTDLSNQGYINSNAFQTTPWGGSYQFETHDDWLYLRTNVPSDVQQVLLARLPAAWTSGTDIYAATLPNGLDMAVSGNALIMKAGTDAERTMNDDLLLGDNNITNVADPVDDQDLLNLFTAQDRFVNLTGDVITGTLSVKRSTYLRASAYSGPGNTGDVWDPAGTTIIRNRHTIVSDIYIRALGKWASQL